MSVSHVVNSNGYLVYFSDHKMSKVPKIITGEVGFMFQFQTFKLPNSSPSNLKDCPSDCVITVLLTLEK